MKLTLYRLWGYKPHEDPPVSVLRLTKVLEMAGAFDG